MVRMVKTFMYKHPRREHGLGSVLAVLVPIAIFFVAALAPMNLGSKAVMAATGPLIVDGHIYSETDALVSGASVTVSVYNGATLRSSQATTSDGSGFYTVTFGNSDWDLGNTIRVTASKLTSSGQNETTATDSFMTIDVHFGTVIPELGGPTLVLALGGVALPIVVLTHRQRARHT